MILTCERSFYLFKLETSLVYMSVFSTCAYVRLFGLHASVILLSPLLILPQKNCDYKRFILHPALLWVSSGDLNSSPLVWTVCSLTNIPPTQISMLLFCLKFFINHWLALRNFQILWNYFSVICSLASVHPKVIFHFCPSLLYLVAPYHLVHILLE